MSGLAVRCALPISEAFGASSSIPNHWDVDIRSERIPAWSGPTLKADGGSISFRKDELGRFQARAGSEVLFDPEPRVPHVRLLPPVLGSGLGLVLSQRGLLPLHATGIEVGDGAVVFAGRAGTGKSTLAAYLRNRGYRVLCDDMLALDLSRAPLALPGLPILKLTPADIRALAVRDPSFPWPGSSKRVVGLGASFCDSPLPLRAIFVLTWGECASIEEVPDAAAFVMLQRRAFRGAWLRSLRLAGPTFDRVASVVESVPVLQFTRARRFEAFGEAVDRLLDSIDGSARRP